MTRLLAIILVFGFAFALAKRLHAYAEKHKNDPMRSFRLYTGPEAKKSDGRLGGLFTLWHSWGFLVAVSGAFNYIYKAYKTAPLGSAAKFGWGAVMALIAAVALFAIVKLIDRKLNPPQSGAEIEAQRDEPSTTLTHGRMTDQWEYRR